MNGLRCWPGCLARVIRVDAPSIALGMIVQVVRPIGRYRAGDRFVWDFQFLAAARDMFLWEVKHSDGRLAVSADDALTPIVPPPGTSLELADIDLDLHAAHERGEFV